MLIIICVLHLLCSAVLGYSARIVELTAKISSLEYELYKYVTELAELKDPVGLLKLAEMREVGTPYVEENKKEAFMMYSMLKDPKSIYKVGLFNLYGATVPKDEKKAFKSFSEAANHGNSMAMYYLGYMYQNALGVRVSFKKAKSCYKLAANLGNAQAIGALGFMYQKGYGVDDIDNKIAEDYYELAANLGNTEAMVYLGSMYCTGLEVERDYQKAKEFYEEAASLGNTEAMGGLGIIYQMGQGVDADNGKAKEWYERAVSLGDPAAEKLLKNLNEKIEINQLQNDPEINQIQRINSVAKRERQNPESGTSSSHDKRPKLE